MKILSSIQMKQVDAYTIESEPISSIDLMERVATMIAHKITQRWEIKTPIVVFAGPGNNGGDALAVSRMLIQRGYEVKTYLFNIEDRLSEDCDSNRNKLQQINDVDFTEVTDKFEPPTLTSDTLVLDGLFGTGLKKALSGGFAAVVKYINSSPATVVSIDIPSGLMCEYNTYNIKNHIIRADITLSLHLPKLAFLFPENADFIGDWEILNIGLNEKAISETTTNWYITEKVELLKLIKARNRFAHKGDFGHALLFAGSYGMAGASILSALACLKSGVGKLTVHAPLKNNDILQISVPEAVVQHDSHERLFATPVYTDSYSAVGIGPGLGQEEETVTALLEQIKLCQCPMVLDADALNIISKHRHCLSFIPKGSILTPHVKELDRLVGKSNSSFERLAKAKDIAANYKIYVIVKGAYSAIITPEGNCYFNPTGNPGMATAGSGDVLTGILLSLLAQGYTPEDCCKLGVYVHGLAGDCAKNLLGERSLTSTDIIESLPTAWLNLTESIDK